LGANHPDTLTSLNNLALSLLNKREREAAEPMLRRVLAGREAILGPDHPETLASLNNLAAMLEGAGQYKEAEPLYGRALAGLERQLGPEHQDTSICRISWQRCQSLLQQKAAPRRRWWQFWK
jgi:hypothetical protein